MPRAIHRPANPNGHGLAVTHGAGANANAPLLVAVAEAFCAAGYTVLRFSLPFREKRPFGPPSPSGAAEDRAGIRAACAQVRTAVPGKLILAGHSYGGRQSSMLLAEDPAVADALLPLSYPLHPPNKPEKSRTEHLPNLRTPTIFVHGTKDGFGSIAEIESARKLIPAPVRLHIVDGAGHDLALGNFNLAPVIAEFDSYFAGAGFGGASATASVI